jgi:hypothetical protein
LSHPGSGFHEVEYGAFRIATSLEVRRELGCDRHALACIAFLEPRRDAVVQLLPLRCGHALIKHGAVDGVLEAEALARAAVRPMAGTRSVD